MQWIAIWSCITHTHANHAPQSIQIVFISVLSFHCFGCYRAQNYELHVLWCTYFFVWPYAGFSFDFSLAFFLSLSFRDHNFFSFQKEENCRFFLFFVRSSNLQLPFFVVLNNIFSDLFDDVVSSVLRSILFRINCRCESSTDTHFSRAQIHNTNRHCIMNENRARVSAGKQKINPVRNFNFLSRWMGCKCAPIPTDLITCQIDATEMNRCDISVALWMRRRHPVLTKHKTVAHRRATIWFSNIFSILLTSWTCAKKIANLHAVSSWHSSLSACSLRSRENFFMHLLLRANEWWNSSVLMNTIALQNGSGTRKRERRPHHLRQTIEQVCLAYFRTIIVADI